MSFDNTSWAGKFFRYLYRKVIVDMQYDENDREYKMYRPDGSYTTLPGGGGGDTSFNGNRPITRAIPGLQGINLGGSELTQVFERMLFPAVGPTGNVSASDPVRLFGAPTAVRLYFNVNPGTNNVTGIILAGQTIDPDYLNGYLDTTVQPNTTTSFTLFATDGDLDMTAQTSVTYQHKRMWLQSATDLLQATDAELSTLLQGTGTSEFATGRQQSRSFNLSNEYNCFAYPASFGAAAFIVGGLPNTAYQLRQFQYTNAFGYTEPYYLYRSGSKSTATLAVDVQ